MQTRQAHRDSATTQHDMGTDAGRQWTDADARRLLRGWDPTHQTLGDYARALGVRASRLWYWKTKFERAAAGPPLAFLPVVVKPPAPPRPPAPRGDFEVVLGAGRRVRVPADFEPAALARLIQALEAVPSC